MHGVLFLHTPEGDPAALLGLARIFGEPIRNPHPKFGALPEFPEVSVVVNDAANPPDINVWHTDTTFMQVPAGVCVLQCQECPPEGGDTLWASMYAAHDALSPGLRAWLATLQAEHRLPLDTVSPALVRSLGEREIAALHPLVRWIPETGRRSLFVNRVYTKRIAGLHRTESSGLLSMLFDLAESPDFQVRLRWQPGDIAIWDNRITQHFATADYYPARRVMHRIALRGEAPLPVPAA
jgi:taurine dioxygenase